MTDYRDLSAGLAARMALEKYGFRFSHSLGQNFILDDGLVRRIVEAAGVRAGERVLEIGPGAGVMTRCLAEAGARVVAVELDRSLEPVLDAVLAGFDVRLVFEDILKLDLDALMGEEPFSVVANLPYYITADVVLRLLTGARRPERIVIMVQKEAAERMMARPDTKTWCALAATAQYFGRIEPLMELPPSAFTPLPHVESVLLGIHLYEEKPFAARDEALLLKVIAAAFAMRRKTLANNLTAAFSVNRETALSWIAALGRDGRVRGEVLGIEELCALSDIIGEARG
ncbi:MAG: ribosomal RNA small subunit methyltransferase A [Clostridia bacterium]|nr:ribosomal RNA small subunit methyltransferase A [Clostridia bacterium]